MIDEVPTLKLHGHCKLNADQVREIRHKLANGVMNKVIIIDYNINKKSLTDIKFNRTYKGIV
jgi:hypothetical protein